MMMHGQTLSDREEKLILTFRRAGPAMQDFFYACLRTQAAKGKDYTMGKNDRLANFKDGAAGLGDPFTPKHIWYVFCWKHWTALVSYVKNGAVESEPVWKRCMDVAVYCSLLCLMAAELGDGAPTKIEDYRAEVDS